MLSSLALTKKVLGYLGMLVLSSLALTKKVLGYLGTLWSFSSVFLKSLYVMKYYQSKLECA